MFILLYGFRILERCPLRPSNSLFLSHSTLRPHAPSELRTCLTSKLKSNPAETRDTLAAFATSILRFFPQVKEKKGEKCRQGGFILYISRHHCLPSVGQWVRRRQTKGCRGGEHLRMKVVCTARVIRHLIGNLSILKCIN